MKTSQIKARWRGMDVFTLLSRYLFVLWWAMTLITIVYYHIVECRIFWAGLKIPLDRPASRPLPVRGRRVDYLNFAFAAGFVGVASFWLGLVELVGANLGVGGLVLALLVGWSLRWSMKIRLRWHVFEGESVPEGEIGPPVER
jgi:hypothetical protein